MSDPSFEKILAKIGNPAKREWFRSSFDHGCQFGSFTETKPGTPQFEAWVVYFERLGWFPHTFALVQRGVLQSWTAPCVWPADLSFVARSVPLSLAPEPTEGVAF